MEDNYFIFITLKIFSTIIWRNFKQEFFLFQIIMNVCWKPINAIKTPPPVPTQWGPTPVSVRKGIPEIRTMLVQVRSLVLQYTTVWCVMKFFVFHFCFKCPYHMVYVISTPYSFFSDINECSTNPCPANSRCQNTVGSYTCTCNFGYQLNTETKQCEGKIISQKNIEAKTIFYIFRIPRYQR